MYSKNNRCAVIVVDILEKSNMAKLLAILTILMTYKVSQACVVTGGTMVCDVIDPSIELFFTHEQLMEVTMLVGLDSAGNYNTRILFISIKSCQVS